MINGNSCYFIRGVDVNVDVKKIFFVGLIICYLKNWFEKWFNSC